MFIDKVQRDVPFFERYEGFRIFEIVTSANNENATIVIDSIDRLGRDLLDILKTLQVLTANKINVKSLKEGFETLIDGEENPISNMVVSIMGSVAEMERNRIKERTKEGIAIAKASGKYKGRKRGSIQSDTNLLRRHKVVVNKIKKGLTVREIASIANCSTTTVMKVKKVLQNRRDL